MDSKVHFKFVKIVNAYGREVSTHINHPTGGDQDMVAANNDWTAFQAKQMGAFYLSPTAEFRRYEDNSGIVHGHQGTVYDLGFSPFYRNLLASCGEDGKVKLWVIPEGGLNNRETEADVVLDEKAKKMHILQWHGIADNTIASAALDNIVRVWDIEKEKTSMTFDNIEQQINCMRWGIDGKTITTISKGGTMIINDVRSNDGKPLKCVTHTGPRVNRCVNADVNHIITCGYNKQAAREMALWDKRNLDKEVWKGPLGQGIGVMHLYFDPELRLLTAVGRGETEASCWEFEPGTAKPLYQSCVNQFKENTRASHMMPKSCVDPQKNEISRMVRIDAKGQLEYTAFTQPTRSGQFLDQLYPPMPSCTPAYTHDEWLSNPEATQPNLVTLTFDTKQNDLVNTKAPNTFMQNHKPRTGALPKKTEQKQVSNENNNNNEEQLKKVAELEDRVKALTKENTELKVPKPAHNLNLKSKPTLGYWNIRGLGAPIRYMLLYCGVEFTDKMYRAGPPPEYDRSEWLDEKFNLGMPFPNLPYLHDEDVKLSETAAIMKYIAGKWKPELLGKDPAVMAELEMLSNYVIQLKITSTMPCYQGKSNQEIMEAVWAPLDQLKEYLGEKEFLTGKNVTWLDFYFFELCMFLDFLSGKIVLEHYPTLGAYCDRFQKLSNFAEHWADDSKTMKWPWNGDMASIGGRGSEL